MPTWQSYPVITEVDYAFNWDYLSTIWPESLYVCIDGDKAVMSEAYMLPNP
jgi:hypothetical protein